MYWAPLTSVNELNDVIGALLSTITVRLMTLASRLPALSVATARNS